MLTKNYVFFYDTYCINQCFCKIFNLYFNLQKKQSFAMGAINSREFEALNELQIQRKTQQQEFTIRREKLETDLKVEILQANLKNML